MLIDWSNQKRKDYGKTFLLDCKNCQKKAYWHLTTTSVMFTVFSIPIFSYRSNYFWVCPECGKKEVLTKKRFLGIRRSVASYDAVRKELGA